MHGMLLTQGMLACWACCHKNLRGTQHARQAMHLFHVRYLVPEAADARFRVSSWGSPPAAFLAALLPRRTIVSKDSADVSRMRIWSLLAARWLASPTRPAMAPKISAARVLRSFFRASRSLQTGRVYNKTPVRDCLRHVSWKSVWFVARCCFTRAASLLNSELGTAFPL